MIILKADISLDDGIDLEAVRYGVGGFARADADLLCPILKDEADDLVKEDRTIDEANVGVKLIMDK